MPANKLTPSERQAIIDVCSEKEFALASPCQIVPKLADRGIFIVSEAAFYRVLKQEGMLRHRGRAKPKGAINHSGILGGPVRSHMDAATDSIFGAGLLAWAWRIRKHPANNGITASKIVS